MATGTRTLPTGQPVDDFLAAVVPARRRQDALALCAMMRRVTGLEPTLWGPSIVGYGSRHYRYESGREGDTMIVGFSPRKGALTLYLPGLDGLADELGRLGAHSRGVGCLYVKALSAVDLGMLEEIVARSFALGRQEQPPAKNGGAPGRHPRQP